MENTEFNIAIELARTTSRHVKNALKNIQNPTKRDMYLYVELICDDLDDKDLVYRELGITVSRRFNLIKYFRTKLFEYFPIKSLIMQIDDDLVIHACKEGYYKGDSIYNQMAKHYLNGDNIRSEIKTKRQSTEKVFKYIICKKIKNSVLSTSYEIEAVVALLFSRMYEPSFEVVKLNIPKCNPIL